MLLCDGCQLCLVCVCECANVVKRVNGSYRSSACPPLRVCVKLKRVDAVQPRSCDDSCERTLVGRVPFRFVHTREIEEATPAVLLRSERCASAQARTWRFPRHQLPICCMPPNGTVPAVNAWLLNCAQRSLCSIKAHTHGPSCMHRQLSSLPCYPRVSRRHR